MMPVPGYPRVVPGPFTLGRSSERAQFDIVESFPEIALEAIRKPHGGYKRLRRPWSGVTLSRRIVEDTPPSRSGSTSVLDRFRLLSRLSDRL